MLTVQAGLGSKRDTEDRIIPRSVDADDSDVEVRSDDERYFQFNNISFFLLPYLFFFKKFG